MRVTVQFRGPLAKQFRKGSIEVECDEGSQLLELLANLIHNEGSVREVWSSPEVMDRDALILCNESDIGLTGGLETVMNDGDVLVVLPLIHGG
ncbi:MAG: MoaD/ThiS family protein [Candidatus Thorarchaeota archaeon]|jgi:molybdopterin converting factor small subunit